MAEQRPDWLPDHIGIGPGGRLYQRDRKTDPSDALQAPEPGLLVWEGRPFGPSLAEIEDEAQGDELRSSGQDRA